MARGNIYLLVPDAEKNNPVPTKLKERWKFKDQQANEATGETTEVDVHPSWIGAGNRLKQHFGEVRTLTFQGQNYILIEMELSFVDGEVDAVRALQSNQTGKKYWYRMLTNTEAQDILRGVDIFQ